MENHDEIKIAKIKNLNKLNWTANMNILIDSNVNISSILSIESYTYDEKLECGQGRASVSGKIGVKVVYIDTDNISNTLFDSIPFSEACVDPAITSSSNIEITESCVTSNIISTDGMLKLSLDCSIGLVMYLNLGLSTSIGDIEGLIVKRSNIDTYLISQNINTEFEYTVDLETGYKVNKILNYSSSFTPSGVTSQDGFATVEGKLMSLLTYEANVEDSAVIKEICSTDTVKLDLSIAGIGPEDKLMLYFSVDKDKTKLNTELEADSTEVSATNTIRVRGVAIRSISIDIVDDLFSCDNVIDTSSSNREYLSSINNGYVTERISADKELENVQIEDVVGCSNVQTTITQHYLKDDSLILEGVATVCVVYLDENRCYSNSLVEVPFVIDTKTTTNNPEAVNFVTKCFNVEAKAKHADTIVVECDLGVMYTLFDQSNREIIDNVIVGKPIEYKNIDYQIFIARPGETNWDLCKRTRTSQDEILKLNKDLPDTFTGGEKIIVKR